MSSGVWPACSHKRPGQIVQPGDDHLLQLPRPIRVLDHIGQARHHVLAIGDLRIHHALCGQVLPVRRSTRYPASLVEPRSTAIPKRRIVRRQHGHDLIANDGCCCPPIVRAQDVRQPLGGDKVHAQTA